MNRLDLYPPYVSCRFYWD